MEIKLTINKGIRESIPTRIQRELKTSFRIFFEGYDETDIPVIPVQICRFEITNITFEKVNGIIEMSITLVKPGLLIGKAGSTIDALKSYLSTDKRPVKVNIIESDLWRN